MSVAISARPDYFRIQRAPLLDPPYEDGVDANPDTMPYTPPPSALLLAPPAAAVPVPSAPPAVPTVEALAGASPACQTAALRFLNVFLELLNGHRSQQQMRPLLHVEHALTVLDELTRITRHVSDLRKRRQMRRVCRSGLRICEPRPGAAEVAAVLNDGNRAWAVCYRLERHANVWRCVYLRAALPTAWPRRAPGAPARQPNPRTSS